MIRWVLKFTFQLQKKEANLWLVERAVRLQ